MSFKKTFLWCLAADGLLILLCWLGEGEALFFPFFVCGAQCLIGSILCFGNRTRVLGKALLLSGLMGVVIGFSVCSANFRLDTK
ncbi:hypothetical protein C7T94_06620 [Pedobacter yulinensis]|uniref:Uncharacterized protein n=1 Tax=Pedobacter yulinensis TaxID=2126353 RepID=A0A2T3HPM6_9SPHI|nr:hypothetical protein C7T94_06620 [Pedobacter yulinensis]